MWKILDKGHDIKSPICFWRLTSMSLYSSVEGVDKRSPKEGVTGPIHQRTRSQRHPKDNLKTERYVEVLTLGESPVSILFLTFSFILTVEWEDSKLEDSKRKDSKPGRHVR